MPTTIDAPKFSLPVLQPDETQRQESPEYVRLSAASAARVAAGLTEAESP